MTTSLDPNGSAVVLTEIYDFVVEMGWTYC